VVVFSQKNLTGRSRPTGTNAFSAVDITDVMLDD